MWLILFRVFIIALLAHAGYVEWRFPGQPSLGVGLGVVAALAVIALEMKLRAVPGHHMIGALIGGVVGLFGARLVWGALAGLDIVGAHFVHALLVVFLGYMGIAIGGSKGEWFEPGRIIAPLPDSGPPHPVKSPCT